MIVRPPVFVSAPITHNNPRPGDAAAELELQRRELLGRIAVRDGRAPFWEAPFRCFENGHDHQLSAASIAHTVALTTLGQLWVLEPDGPRSRSEIAGFAAVVFTPAQHAVLEAWRLRRGPGGDGIRMATWDGWKVMADRYNYRAAWLDLASREVAGG